MLDLLYVDKNSPPIAKMPKPAIIMVTKTKYIKCFMYEQ